MGVNKKDIVIVSDFCDHLDDNANNRFLYIANLLSQENDVEIVTSDFYHVSKSKFDPKITSYKNTKVTMLEEPIYKKNISLKRFFSHYIWGKNVKKYLKRRKKPDIVYCAVPTLKAASITAKYCKKNNIKFIIDIQDLWPEAFKMIFNIPIVSSLVFFPFNVLANSAYKRADQVIAVSQTYANRALKVNKKVSCGKSVFLGTNLKVFDTYKNDNTPLKEDKNIIWLGYCGTLGASYDLSCVLKALKIIKDKGYNNYKFIVMGDGPQKTEFENIAKNLDVNAEFTGRLPYPKMVGILCACDIVVNPIKHNAAQSIINKHADYAASGLPVINTQECQEYRELVDKYQMGINCKNNDENSVSDAILKLFSDEQLRLTMGLNSRKCAEELFNREKTYVDLIEEVLK